MKTKSEIKQIKLTLDLKKYLNKLGLYKGDVNSYNQDIDFILGLEKLENIIAKSINNGAVYGMIWRNGKINEETSVEDIKRSFRLIRQGQATVNTFNPEENAMTEFTFVVDPEATKSETGDPDSSQQIGKMQQQISNEMAEEEEAGEKPEKIEEKIEKSMNNK